MDRVTFTPTPEQQKFMDDNGVTSFMESGWDGCIRAYHSDERYQRCSTIDPQGRIFHQASWKKSKGDIAAEQTNPTAATTDDAKLDLATCQAILAAAPS